MPASGNSAPGFGRPPSNPLDYENFQRASERAATQPLQFNPGERASYVRAMVNRVLEYRREGKSVNDIKGYLPEFAEEYKHLFEMLTMPEGYDARNLQIMLGMLDQMGRGNLSQHEASVIVGKRLFEKYGKTP